MMSEGIDKAMENLQVREEGQEEPTGTIEDLQDDRIEVKGGLHDGDDQVDVKSESIDDRGTSDENDTEEEGLQGESATIDLRTEDMDGDGTIDEKEAEKAALKEKLQQLEKEIAERKAALAVEAQEPVDDDDSQQTKLEDTSIPTSPSAEPIAIPTGPRAMSVPTGPKAMSMPKAPKAMFTGHNPSTIGPKAMAKDTSIPTGPAAYGAAPIPAGPNAQGLSFASKTSLTWRPKAQEPKESEGIIDERLQRLERELTEMRLRVEQLGDSDDEKDGVARKQKPRDHEAEDSHPTMPISLNQWAQASKGSTSASQAPQRDDEPLNQDIWDEAMSTANPPTQKVSDIISTFRPTRRIPTDKPTAHITSLDFDDTGELALTTNSSELLQIFHCKEGKLAKDLQSQKYGCALARFTHHAQSILYASTKGDDNIRYLSTHDNSFIRYFRGHEGRVTSISMSPADDGFITSSLDDTVKIWSLKSSSPTGTLKIHQPLLTAYDPTATVFAVASATCQVLLLYDVRNFDKPPFATFDMLPTEAMFQNIGGPGVREWTKLEFSNDGKCILVATAGSGHYILDAFEGSIRHFCVRRAHSGRLPPSQIGNAGSMGIAGQGDACLSPDGRYLLSGHGEEGLLVWDLHAEPASDHILRPMSELPGLGKASVVGYNQRFNLVITADKDVVFWLPDPEVG